MRFVKSIIRLCQAFGRRLEYDHVSAHAAECAFFIFVSFFPFVMFLLTLFHYLPFTETQLIEMASRFIPKGVVEFISPLISEIFSSGTAAVISVTVVAAIWTASKGFYSLIMGMNAVFRRKESRNYFVLRLLSMAYTIIFAIFLIILLALFILSSGLFAELRLKLDFLDAVPVIASGIPYVLSAIVMVLAGLIIYSFLPDKGNKLLKQIPGAVLSGAGWVLFSFLYSLYIENLANMTATYGSLTTVVVTMLWLYFCMYITYLGAELNTMIANKRLTRAVKKLVKRREKEGEKDERENQTEI